MIKFKIFPIESRPAARGAIVFKNEICGHEQHCEYTIPWNCQHQGCNQRNPSYERLCGEHNQDVRVGYYANGKL